MTFQLKVFELSKADLDPTAGQEACASGRSRSVCGVSSLRSIVPSSVAPVRSGRRVSSIADRGMRRSSK
jgi:hypothetical protein